MLCDKTMFSESADGFTLIQAARDFRGSDVTFIAAVPVSIPYFAVKESMGNSSTVKVFANKIQDAIMQTSPARSAVVRFQEEIQRARMRPGVRKSFGAKRWPSSRGG